MPPLFVEISKDFWVLVSDIKVIYYDAKQNWYAVKRGSSDNWTYVKENPYRKNIVALIPA